MPSCPVLLSMESAFYAAHAGHREGPFSLGENGKLILTGASEGLISGGQFPCGPQHSWSHSQEPGHVCPHKTAPEHSQQLMHNGPKRGTTPMFPKVDTAGPPARRGHLPGQSQVDTARCVACSPISLVTSCFHGLKNGSQQAREKMFEGTLGPDTRQLLTTCGRETQKPSP